MRVLRFAAATLSICLAVVAPALAAHVPGSTTSASTAKRASHLIVAGKAVGVRELLGFHLRGGRRVSGSPLTLRDLAGRLGRPRRMLSGKRCRAVWAGRRARIVVTTIAGRSRCGKRRVRAAAFVGPAWRLRIGKRMYRVGMAAGRLPGSGRNRKGHSAFVLAAVRRGGRRLPAVVAVARRGRVSRLLVVFRAGRASAGAPQAPGSGPQGDDTGASEQDKDLGKTLSAGQRLHAGEYLSASNGRYTLKMQDDGNLVLRVRGGRAIWSSKTSGSNTAVMQGDGNLVVYRKGGKALWSTKTAGSAARRLDLGDDGNAVLHDKKRKKTFWATKTIVRALHDGETLLRGESLRSSGHHRYRLVMQGDGNLAMYVRGGRTVWSTGTAGTEANRLVMQGDGNAVLYTKGGKALWNTKTAGSKARELYLTDDSRLQLFSHNPRKQVWSSGNQNARLYRGERLEKGEVLYSPQRTYRLVMQGDGNLVIYKGGKALWSTRTDGSGGDRVVMQGDGNLVIYDGGHAEWASHTEGKGGKYIRIKDGKLTMYKSGGAKVWQRPKSSGGGGGTSSPQWWPLRGTNLIGCTFHSPGGYCGDYHTWWALDIQGPEGQKVYASGAGTASIHSNSSACSGYGRSVIVDHGSYGKSLYAHLSAILVGNGQKVTAKTAIGKVGHTGAVSSCSYNHLHYEETSASGSFGPSGSPRDPGQFKACHGSKLVKYPNAWGKSSWYGLAGHTYSAKSDGTGCG